MCPSSGGRGGNDMIWMKKAMALCLALLLVCGAAWAEQENDVSCRRKGLRPLA